MLSSMRTVLEAPASDVANLKVLLRLPAVDEGAVPGIGDVNAVNDDDAWLAAPSCHVVTEGAAL